MALQLPDYAAEWELTLVETQTEVDAFLAWVADLRGLVSIDTETNGLTWWRRDFVRLVTIADDRRGFAIPVRWWGKVLEQALSRIRDRHLPVGMWNAGFDMHALEGDGFPIPHWHNVIDGYVLHHLLEPHHRHGLKFVAGKDLGKWATVGDAMLKAKAKELGYGSEWWAVPVDLPEYWHYATIDTLLTQKLIRLLGPLVDQHGMMEAYENQMHSLSVMWRAEKRGMRVDHKYAEKTRREWLAKAVRIKDYLSDHGLANPNSEKQIEDIFRELGWQPEDFTATGQAVLDKIVLAELQKKWPDMAEGIIEYKRLTKWVGSYLDPFAASGGRVFPSINTLRAKTGRMSITAPALQTLPSKGSAGAIRKCVIPDAGKKIWLCDYDGQEARLFANFSGDPGMAEAYAKGLDLYTYVGQIVYQDPTIDKDHPIRQRCKVIMLAWSYGAGVEKLSLASGLPKREVERFLAQLFKAFPKVKDMTGDHAIGGNLIGRPAMEATQRLKDEGLAYIMTSGGRRFSMPDGEFYKAINGLCQGSGADVLTNAIIRLDRAGLADGIIVPVHDELVVQFPEDDLDSPREVHRLMEDFSWKIPLTCSLSGPFNSWGEAYV